MSSPPGGQNVDSLTGFNRQSVRELVVVDRLIPASTLYFFFDFTFEGNLYSGGKSRLPLIQEDEVPFFSRPYANWAPSPYNRTASSVQERILIRPPEFDATVERRISCMRARLWEGMVPMSGARWREKKLDDPKNWQFTFEFLLDTIYTFMWLGDPDIQAGIQGSFNFVAKELETFQDAVNARRAQNGLATRINMTALWLEFIQDLFETMVTRTHSWFVDRVDEIITKGKAEYDAAVDANGAANSADAAKKFLESWSDLNRLLKMADYTIMMPMDGFTGFSASNSNSKVVGSMFPPPFRLDQQDELSAQMAWPVCTRLLPTIQSVYTNPGSINAILKETKENNDRLRIQMRGEPKKLGREHWISIIKSRTDWSLSHGGPQDQRWGFVAYMLTRKPTKEQWETFFARVNVDFQRSGEWVEGFDEVKQNAALQWIDAKAIGIPDNDIEAAKRHFQTFRNTSASRKRAWKMDFFVVDAESFASYMDSPTTFQNRKPYGDHGGFLKLIDTTAYDPRLIAETAPGFRNELKVLGSLVFDDVYPLVVSLAQRPRDLWPYAMLHPNQVYVGPTVESQEKEWEKVWKLRKVYWSAFWKWRSERGA